MCGCANCNVKGLPTGTWLQAIRSYNTNIIVIKKKKVEQERTAELIR